MEVVTIETSVFKYLKEKLCTIEQVMIDLRDKMESEPEDGWMDSHEVCTALNISRRTLQRLCTANAIEYSHVRGKNFYLISEIQRLLKANIIRRKDNNLQDLIKNRKLYVEQKRTIRTNK